ncbi:MAG: amino acid adenylation protein, partial [Segetibacter sp.]|nr:amino acid adenylation protein [Segetibacter sp.]
ILNKLQTENLTLPDLKYWTCSGETLPCDLVTDFYKLFSSTCHTLLNIYGSTEVTADVTYYDTTADLIHKSLTEVQSNTIPNIPIGKPLANCKVFIIDQDHTLVAEGLVGEICVAGIQVANGYLNRPELTEEKFALNPFSKSGEEKMYRTGDLGRWLKNGNIEYLGRLDSQVKIRGNRVEPEEIENVLLNSGLVSQVAIVAKEDTEGNKQLVGYLIPGKTFDKKVINSYLHERLPDYMVPSMWIEVDDFPLLPNGKIDRKAMPEPDKIERLVKFYVSARNETEDKLVKIWQNLLRIDGIGIYDNFFELGGHSLLAMRVVSAIRNQLQVEVSIKDLFLHSTVSSLAESIQSREGNTPVGSIKVNEKKGKIPLSFSQERLWFIDKLNGSVQYHLPTILRLQGNLNTQALEYALQAVINRHEVLRTIFREEDGIACQFLKNPGEWKLYLIDGLHFKQNDKSLKQWIKEFTNKPFDLSNDHMLRAALVQLEEQEYILVVTLHHIASDGWSTSVLVREVVELYSSFEENRENSLSPLPIQYSDYAIWQRDYLQGDTLDKKLQYWKEKLNGVTPLQLPTDFARQAVQGTNGAVTTFSLDQEILHSLHLVSKAQDATLFMTLLAAFNVLLFRYSGQTDICLGIPAANRTQHEVEDLIGFFVNTLALRNVFTEATSFFELLQTVRSTTLQAYEHQDVPFEKVVDEVVKERDISRSPLFQVMFVLQNTPDVQKLKLGEVKLLQETSDRSTAKFELTMAVVETAKGLIGSIEYNTDLYTDATICRMIEHFKTLIVSIVQNPRVAIEALKMLTTAEEEQILVDFNKTEADYPKEKSVIDLFEEQAAKTPQATAIVFEDEQVTYSQLNTRANQLARYLRTKGVKQESLVPICLDRSVEMLVSIVGVLKAGAAYVPIDPEYPEERIEYILNDTSASLFLTNRKDKITTAVDNDIEQIDLERYSSEISRQGSNNLDAIIEPDQLAYIIYTSGSTGRPKGVMIEHRSVVNLIAYQAKKFAIEGDEKILQFSNYSFDASVEQIFIAFFTGSTLVVAGKELVRSPQLLLEYIINNRITHFHCTPTYLKTVTPGEYGSLKRVIAGGEQCSLQLATSWGKKVDFFNEYGPTETTVTIIEHQFSSSSDVSVLPIGKPITNTKIYILGEGKQLQPIGISGEIYIGGVALSRGYLNLPELTAEKFIKDPFSKVEASRLYRTGDMGRWLYNGTIEYLGRIDSQVKIRGYRIELGEIESVLLESGLVDKAVVLVKEDSNGNKRLVGYAVAENRFDKQAITNYLYTRLPEYMVPALWLELESLPLTANGKINTKFLLNLDSGKIAENEYVRPESDVQAALAGIWEHLLGVESIGIHDNFFELGGDSITTIQVVSRANKLGYHLQPKDIFIHQTIAGLTGAIAERTENAITAEQGVLTGASGLLPIQQWYLQNEKKDISHFNQSILLSIEKTVTEQTLDKAVKHLVIHHDALRFKYYRQDGQWQQEYATVEGGLLTEDLGEMEGPLAQLITERAIKYQRTLDIEKAQLIRVVLIRTPQTEEKNRLLIVIHHLAIDGVSWRILLEDFELLLTSLTNNGNPELGNKTSSYRQWYNALEQYGQSKRLISQKNYWQEALKGYRPIKTDTEYTGAVRIKDTARYSVRLNVDETRRLLQEVPVVYHTEINDLLLSALARTLCEWSETDLVVIGHEGHGREDIVEGIDTSRTVGWFTNLYPVFLQAGESQDSDELIKTVKEQLRQIPDKGLGYGVLKYINKEEDLQNTKCWDVVFNYFGQLDNIVRESQWFTGAGERSGAMSSEELTVSEKLAINGM